MSTHTVHVGEVERSGRDLYNTCIKESPTLPFHLLPPDDRPGAHGAVGAALATPTFSPKMGVSNMWVYLMSFIVVFNHCMNFLLCNCMYGHLFVLNK